MQLQRRLDLMIRQGTHRSASPSRSGFGSVISMAWSSAIRNWSELVNEPVDICGGASDFADMARSSNHLTSSTVTLEPSCQVASGRRVIARSHASTAPAQPGAGNNALVLPCR